MASNFNTSSFTLINDKIGQLVIYSTTDTSQNLMTFTITNNTGSDVKLTGGTAVSGHGGASSIVFDFGLVLTGDESSAVKIKDDTDSWNAVFFPAQPHGNPTWAVAPNNDTTLAAGTIVTFHFSNLACSSQKPGNFDVMFYNIPGMADRTFPFTYHISVRNPPVGKNLADYVDWGLVLNSVVHLIGNQSQVLSDEVGTDPGTGAVVSPQTPIPVDITYNNSFPIKNGFTFYLKNKSGADLEPSGTPVGAAVFYVSLVFATDDPHALTSQALGDSIVIGVNPEKSSWGNPAHQKGDAFWPFKPQSPELMFKDETVQFPLSNIITELNTPPNTITRLYIDYRNLAGFADGTLTLELQKQVAVAKITNHTIQPPSIKLGDNVSFTFAAEVACKATLDYLLRDGTKVQLKSPDNFAYYGGTFQPTPAPTAETTVFNLAVYDVGTDPSDQWSGTINVVQPVPSITSFTASSMLVDINGTNTTTLSWAIANITGVKSIYIDKGVGQQDPTKATGSVLVTINNSVTFTITVTPWGVKDPPLMMRVTVYAYKSYSPVLVGPMGTGAQTQTLPLSIANLTQSVIYVSNITAQGTYIVNTKTKTVSQGLNGWAMALSVDETRFFTAGNGVMMADTANIGDQPVSLPAPGPPAVSLAINPACNKLFYLQRNNTTAVSVFNVVAQPMAMAYVTDVTVGNSPQPYVFDGQGANLYIGNYQGQSVSVLNVNANPPTVTATISLTTTEPNAMALVGTHLFVACSGSNMVEVIDTTNNSNIKQIACGYQPFSLTLSQNKARLFVTNFQGASVSIIDTSSMAVTATLPVGQGPSAAKITDSGNLMFVSNYCDKSVTVVDLSNNGAVVVGTLALEATNGNPIDISTFTTLHNYTDIFIAKEYYQGRNNGCSGSKPTDSTLNMSIFSVQELKLDLEDAHPVSVHPEVKPPVPPVPPQIVVPPTPPGQPSRPVPPVAPPVPAKPSLWQRIAGWWKRLFGGGRNTQAILLYLILQSLCHGL